MLGMSFKKLQIWQKAMLLADTVYVVTRNLPKEELYGLVTQMRRAATSIPSNIAEGSQRSSNKDFANFILIAKGSLAELETQIILCKNQGFLSEEREKELLVLTEELSKMMYAFHASLKTHDS
jgi:four helix bundle protein